MQEKVDIKVFIETYKASTTKEEVIKTIVTSHYIQYSVKHAVAYGVINRSIKNIEGAEIMNSPLAKLNRIMSMISLYTNLDFTKVGSYIGYDLLIENDVLGTIINEIGEDVDRYNEVYDMTLQDKKDEILNPRLFIAKQISKIITMCDTGLGKMAEALEKVDVEKVAEKLKLLKKDTTEQQ